MTKATKWILGVCGVLGLLLILTLLKGMFTLMSVFTIPLTTIVSFLSISSIIFRFKNKVVLQFLEKHNLEVLENVNGDVYAIKKITGREPIFIFSYLDENDKKIILTEKNVKVVKKDVENPYMKVYNNVYKPKGLLDSLFYTEEDKQMEPVIYKLYLPEEIITR